MTEEELKNKYKERAKIFQQAMKSCKSSSPMDCIEWFADRIAGLEKENADLKEEINKIAFARGNLEEENSKLILGNKSLSERLTSVTREKLDLQKENAELKEKYKASQELVTYYKSILKGE